MSRPIPPSPHVAGSASRPADSAVDDTNSALVAVAPADCVRDGVLERAAPLQLHHGGRIEVPRFAWRLRGPEGAPVVAALGGISADRRVAAEDEGWWSALVGPDRPLDTRRLRVLGIDWLGGSGASSGPGEGEAPFPTVSSYDQAAMLATLVESLGIGTLHAIVGASYGAMVALAAGERHPALARRLLAISGVDRAHPLSTAWRSVQREIVRFGAAHGDARGGLRLARALAMATYRSPEEFASRFAAPAQNVDGRMRFPVESYLYARGDAYAARYVPEAFVTLSESIDLHAVDARRVAPPVTLVGVAEDQLVPLAHVESLAARLPDCRLHVISSTYGHDAFLKEAERLRPIFAECLEGPAR